MPAMMNATATQPISRMSPAVSETRLSAHRTMNDSDEDDDVHVAPNFVEGQYAGSRFHPGVMIL